MKELPTGAVTFLFTDIEGSTRLVSALGPAYLDVHAAHQRIIRDAVAANRGLEVSTEGDSFFVVFEHATDAVEAAVAVQRALAEEEWPPDAPVRVRMGIHSGQGIRGGDNYIGLDVNRTARIAAAGHGGQVLLSEPTRDALGAVFPDDVGLLDLGRHRLRDVGVEHLWQLRAAGLPAEFGPLRTLEVHPSNLPGELTALIDRESERERLTALVRTSPLVTVTGPGGIGKSRLAIRVALDLVAGLPDGVFYVDAVGLAAADDLADALARAVGVRVGPGSSATDGMLEFLRRRSALLVVDTADRVRGGGRLLAQLAGACPDARFLVTSRGALRVAGEQELPVGPLAVVGSGDPATISASPAVRLFVDRARAVRPDFEVGPDKAAAIAQICRQLDGLPLAIELAAARVRVLSPDAILTRLTRRFALLTGGSADAPDRQRTLRAAIDWSYELLQPAEQAFLGRLSVFAGPFDLDAAEAAAGTGQGQGEPGVDALDAVQRLVDQGLVVAETASGEPRFRLPATIREFGREMLESAGELTAARAAHAAWFGSVAERWGPEVEGARDLQAIARLEASVDEFRAALAWLLDPPQDGRAGLAMAAALGRFWYLRAHVREGRAWLERALARAPAVPDHERARALFWAGVLAEESRQPEAAAAWLEQNLALLNELGDARAIARTLNSLGVVARSMGDLDRAEALFLDSLERKRALGDDHGVAGSLSNLGLVAADRGRLIEARDRFREALALDQVAGERGPEAFSLNNLGASEIWLGNVEEGVANVRRALVVFVELDDADGIAEAIEHLGEAAAARADYRNAARLILIAAAVREQAGATLRDIDAVRVRAALAAAEQVVPPADLAAMRVAAAALDPAAAAEVALAIATRPAGIGA